MSNPDPLVFVIESTSCTVLAKIFLRYALVWDHECMSWLQLTSATVDITFQRDRSCSKVLAVEPTLCRPVNTILQFTPVRCATCTFGVGLNKVGSRDSSVRWFLPIRSCLARWFRIWFIFGVCRKFAEISSIYVDQRILYIRQNILGVFPRCVYILYAWSSCPLKFFWYIWR